ncbi:hypothetical protein AAFF_G00076120 [Aldrovandia affinis]|uniref:Guanylate-binding protein/Atlastin C-terminal domain-containing protein n=1 Tax=Aldrovandia affinis TaxID=143900 RepID=A0AAD7WCZ1_9TELE|nr:hypothetical protein AAFF_G00076120 [Aldrovandia affinis]
MDQERSYRENMEQLMRKMEEDRKNAAEEYQRALTAKLEEQQNLYQQGFAKKAEVMQAEINSLKKEKDENQKS